MSEPSPRARRGAGPTGGWAAMEHRLSAEQTVHVAGLYAEGQRCLTLHHGELKTAADEQSYLTLLEVLDEHADQQVTRVHTRTGMTCWWESTTTQHADVVVEHVRGRFQRLLRPGWSASEHP